MHVNTLRFEADPDGGGEPAAPAPGALESVAPVAPPPSGWTGPSQEEWQRTQQFQDAILAALMEEEPEPGVPATPPSPLDLSTPEKVLELIESKATEIADAKLAERLGPYAPMMDELAAEKGKALVHAELTKIAKGDPERGVEGVGEFDLDMAGKLAQSFHMSGVAPEQAIRLAAQETRAYEERIRQSALTAQQGQINNRIDADRSPPPGGAASEATSAREGEDRYQKIAREWEEHKKATGSPVG